MAKRPSNHYRGSTPREVKQLRALARAHTPAGLPECTGSASRLSLRWGAGGDEPREPDPGLGLSRRERVVPALYTT
jgi:hypothetical protein